MKYLEDMSIKELKDYILGLIAIPFENYTKADEENQEEARKVLLEKGWETIYKNDSDVTFRKTEWLERATMKKGNWLLRHKDTQRTIAVCIVEDSPLTYTTSQNTIYLKSDWDAIARCSRSLVLG